MDHPALSAYLEQVLELAARDPQADVGEESPADIVGRMVGAIARGDFEAFGADLEEQAELTIDGPADLPFRGSWRGRTEIVAAIRRNFGMVKSETNAVERVVARGQTVIVVSRERGRYIADDQPYHVDIVHVFKFAGGKLLRCHEMVDHVVA